MLTGSTVPVCVLSLLTGTELLLIIVLFHKTSIVIVIIIIVSNYTISQNRPTHPPTHILLPEINQLKFNAQARNIQREVHR